VQVTVRLFAVARQCVGKPEVTVEVPEPATVGGLRRILGEHFPVLVPILSNLLFAVAAEYARDGDPIASGVEVAAIPPVSGGGPCPD
jgi:sulfur-carrier protein